MDDVPDYLALSPQTEETVKAHLFESVRALVAEATVLLEQVAGDRTELEVE